jgi:hypothetical protein
MPADMALQRAGAKISAFGPPYREVEKYIPEAIEAMNEPLPEWRWGSMDQGFAADIDRWVGEHVGPKANDLGGVIEDPLFIETNVSLPGVPATVAVSPRQLLENIVHQFLASPTRRLGELVGQAPTK